MCPILDEISNDSDHTGRQDIAARGHDLRQLLPQEAMSLAHGNAMLEQKAAKLIDHCCSIADQPRTHPMWDDPKGHPWTMGFFISYQAEGRIDAAYILKNKPDAKIGVLYQNDDFGMDYLKGLVDGLGDKAAALIKIKTSYETTDPTVASQI